MSISREVAVYVNGQFYQRMIVPMEDRQVTVEAVTSRPAPDVLDDASVIMKQFQGDIEIHCATTATARIVSDEIDFDEDGGLVLKEQDKKRAMA